MNKFEKKVTKGIKKSNLKEKYTSFRVLRMITRAILKDDVLQNKIGDNLYKSSYYNKHWKHADKIL